MQYNLFVHIVICWKTADTYIFIPVNCPSFGVTSLFYRQKREWFYHVSFTLQNSVYSNVYRKFRNRNVGYSFYTFSLICPSFWNLKGGRYPGQVCILVIGMEWIVKIQNIINEILCVCLKPCWLLRIWTLYKKLNSEIPVNFVFIVSITK